jgi:hypothetical protein
MLLTLSLYREEDTFKPLVTLHSLALSLLRFTGANIGSVIKEPLEQQAHEANSPFNFSGLESLKIPENLMELFAKTHTGVTLEFVLGRQPFCKAELLTFKDTSATDRHELQQLTESISALPVPTRDPAIKTEFDPFEL